MLKENIFLSNVITVVDKVALVNPFQRNDHLFIVFKVMFYCYFKL